MQGSNEIHLHRLQIEEKEVQKVNTLKCNCAGITIGLTVIWCLALVSYREDGGEEPMWFYGLFVAFFVLSIVVICGAEQIVRAFKTDEPETQEQKPGQPREGA